MGDRLLSRLLFWRQPRPAARPPARRQPSTKPPPPQRAPRTPSPSPPERSPPREAIGSPSKSPTPSKPRQPSIPDVSPEPTLSRADSKRKPESPRTSRPPTSPTFSTDEIQAQAIPPQLHEPSESSKDSIVEQTPKPSSTQTQTPAVPQVHELKESPKDSIEVQTLKTTKTPSPSPSPSPPPFPAFSAETLAPAIPPVHEPKESPKDSIEVQTTPKTTKTPSPSPSPTFCAQTQAPAIPQVHEPKESSKISTDEQTPKTTKTPSPKFSSQPDSQDYEEQVQPTTQVQDEILKQVTPQQVKEPKQPADLEPKPLPTDPTENGTKETKAEKTPINIPEDRKEDVEEPPKSLEREAKLVSIQDEKHKQKPETPMPEKLRIGITQEREESIEPKPLSIRLDSETPMPHSGRSRLVTKMRISKPKKRDDQDDADGEEQRRQGSNGKESKIKISSIPHPSPTGEQTTFQAEIKEGISKLVEKLSIGHSELLGDGNGVTIVTLAGENKGASMVIGYGSLTKDNSNHIQRETEANKNANKKQKEGSTHARDDEIPAISASINSNVQSVNNSLLHESSSNEEDPGVHLVFSSKPRMQVKTNGKPASIETVKTIPKAVQAQKLTYTPRVRRRCLRGLLLEPSESDREDPQKPQRHGCRVSCDGKKNVKTDIEDASTSINSGGISTK